MTRKLDRKTLARREKRAGARGKTEGSALKSFAAFIAALFATLKAVPAAAASAAPAGAFATVKNTITFMMNLLMGVGICFIAFGVISLAISFQSHDDSQKSKAIMAIVGGAIAVSVKFVIQYIAGDAEGFSNFM